MPIKTQGDLPVKEILITLPEEELICDVCGSKMAMIGKKLVSRLSAPCAQGKG